MYSMKETSEIIGITYQTLKFYCNQGLVPNVKRDKNNYRIFDDNDMEWLKSLTCLKKCGMSIKEIKAYLDLCLQGKETIRIRKNILNMKKEELIKNLKQIQESIDFIDYKQSFYDDILAGKKEYKSSLIKEKD